MSAVPGNGTLARPGQLPVLANHIGAPAYTDTTRDRDGVLDLRRGLTAIVIGGERRRGLPEGLPASIARRRAEEQARDDEVAARLAAARYLAAVRVAADGKGPEPWPPDWAIPPAMVLVEYLEEHGDNVLALAITPRIGSRLDRETARQVRDVLGRKPLTLAHAQALEWGTGVPAGVWLALEHNYRGGLAAGMADAAG
jgi:hypothetical protein